MSNTVPLWFLVKQREFGYKEFLDRYQDISSDELYTAPLFFILVIRKIESYVKGIHILRLLNPNETQTVSRDLVYHFLYWVLTGNISNDLINQQNSISKMSIFKYRVSRSFLKVVEKTIDALLKKFFGISLSYIDKFENVILTDVTKFTDELRKEQFLYTYISMGEVTNLYRLKLILLEIKEWFITQKKPSWISQASMIVVCQNNPPNFLTGLDIPIDILLKSLKNHENFDQSYGIYFDYLEEMVEGLIKVVPQHTDKILDLTKSSPAIDANKVKKFLTPLNPVERMKYFPTYNPILDCQVEKFIEDILRNGFEIALKKYIDAGRDSIRLMYPNKSIPNELTVFRYESIYEYPIDELIWLTYGNIIHVFAHEDLKNQRLNPYNRAILPKNLNVKERSVSYVEKWSKILNRRIIITDRSQIVIKSLKDIRRMSY